MKGIIVINPFGYPSEGLHQAQRMQEEFRKLNVETEIVNNGFTRYYDDGERIKLTVDAIDFAVYFDKDKYFCQALEKSGVRVFNSSEAIRVCDDKGETYLALSGGGVKVPKTVFAPLCYKKEFKIERDSAKSIGDKLGYPLIVKESYGSLGNGVYLAKTEDELYKLMDDLKTAPHLFQEYLGKKKGTDIRIIVIGGKAVACMQRRNENDFRSNLAKGGTGEKLTPSGEFIAEAEKCAKIIGLDYCGVDILYGNSGEPIVCEVNSNAFFSGIESVTGVNVAKLYAEHVVKSQLANAKK